MKFEILWIIACRITATCTNHSVIEGYEFTSASILRVLCKFVDWFTHVIVTSFTFLPQLLRIMFDQSQFAAAIRTIASTFAKARSYSLRNNLHYDTNAQAHTSN